MFFGIRLPLLFRYKHRGELSRNQRIEYSHVGSLDGFRYRIHIFHHSSELNSLQQKKMYALSLIWSLQHVQVKISLDICRCEETSNKLSKNVALVRLILGILSVVLFIVTATASNISARQFKGKCNLSSPYKCQNLGKITSNKQHVRVCEKFLDR